MDTVQASEELYRAVRECIKALAGSLKASWSDKAGRSWWHTWLPVRVAMGLAGMLGEERIRYVWASAYDIHVWDFHKAKYRVEDAEASSSLAGDC